MSGQLPDSGLSIDIAAFTIEVSYLCQGGVTMSAEYRNTHTSIRIARIKHKTWVESSATQVTWCAALIGCSLLASWPRSSEASQIKIDLTYDNTLKGYESLKATTVKGAPAGNIAVDSVTKNNARLATVVDSPYVSGRNYNFPAENIPGADILRMSIGNETFPNFSKSGTYISDQQKANNAGNKQEENGSVPDGHPFDASDSSFFFDDTGQLFDQFVIRNASQTAFNISALQIYSGLDLSFLHTTNFASSSAIASGSLISEDMPDPDTVFLAGNFGMLAFSTPSLSLGEYDLLVVSMQPILPDASLGASFTKSLASFAVPEPDSLSLFGIGLLGFFVWRHRRSAMPRVEII